MTHYRPPSFPRYYRPSGADIDARVRYWREKHNAQLRRQQRNRDAIKGAALVAAVLLAALLLMSLP